MTDEHVERIRYPWTLNASVAVGAVVVVGGMASLILGTLALLVRFVLGLIFGG